MISSLDTIGELSERFEIDVFAFVLMDNHYHLLVRTRLFGVSYSAVSHAVRSLKSKLRDNHELLTTFNKINSQFKL